VLVALAIAVLGSGNLRWFDAALIVYLVLLLGSAGQNGRRYRTVVGEIGTISFDSRSAVCSPRPRPATPWAGMPSARRPAIWPWWCSA
jgi:hypothetical protein